MEFAPLFRGAPVPQYAWWAQQRYARHKRYSKSPLITHMLELPRVISLKLILVLDLHVFHPEVGYYLLPLTSAPFTSTAHLHIQAYISFSVRALTFLKKGGYPVEYFEFCFSQKKETFHLQFFSIFNFISWPDLELVNILVMPIWELEKKNVFLSA